MKIECTNLKRYFGKVIFTNVFLTSLNYRKLTVLTVHKLPLLMS